MDAVINKVKIDEIEEKSMNCFTNDFVKLLNDRINISATQIENGEYMSLKESQERIQKEFFNESRNERV